MRAFFCFVAGREPGAISQCAEILHIPTKKSPIHAPCYLEPEEVKAILSQPDRSTIEGQGDHTLLSLLYNTGARIQEALDVCPKAVHFDTPACVRLYGKGRKERISPLWPETVSLLQSLLQRQTRAVDQPIFINRYGTAIRCLWGTLQTRGICGRSNPNAPGLQSKHVTPHSFRHATAVHLVAAGVDVTVIRSWLGRVSVDTTNHYAQANLETKRKALEQLDRSRHPNNSPSWKREEGVLAWLDTL